MAEEIRQTGGRFKPGNPGNPNGNPGNKGRHWQALLHEATTDDEFKAAWEVVKAAVMGGDLKAANLFFERLMGKAVQAVNVGDSEGGSLVFQIVTAKPEAGK